MKKIVTRGCALVGLIFLSGCGQWHAASEVQVPIKIAENRKNSVAISNESVAKNSFKKARELLGDRGDLTLRKVATQHGFANNEKNNFNDKITFYFCSIDKEVFVDYDLKSGVASITDEFTSKNNCSDAGEVIPDNIANFEFGDIVEALKSNDDYKNYLSKYPKVFEKYTAGINNNSTYGWEWEISYFNDGLARAIKFAINPLTNKVAIIHKKNMD